MLFEQKSRRKSSVEIGACPFKNLTTPYFLLRFPPRFLAAGNKTRSIRIFCIEWGYSQYFYKFFKNIFDS